MASSTMSIDVVNAPRYYQICYRVPPQHQDRPDGPYEPRARIWRYDEAGHYHEIACGEWAERRLVTDAYNAEEAELRLRYRLDRDGYSCSGNPGRPIYVIEDIVPLTKSEWAAHGLPEHDADRDH